MKAYITGVGGVVGSALAPFLKNKGYEVIGSYYQPTTDINEIDPSIRIFELDLRDHAKVMEVIDKELPDVIYHFAAQSRPVPSWSDPYYTMDVNVCGTVAILEAVKAARLAHEGYDPNVIAISSSAIYGDALQQYTEDNLPDESCALLPLHPYGVSKAAEDLLCYQYYKNFGIKTMRIRLFNCTGRNKDQDITGDFAKRAVKLEREGGNKLVVGNLTAKRAILDVRDLCSALYILNEKGSAGEPYNICSSHIFRMDHVVECLEEVMGVKYELVTDPKLLRPADEKLYAGRCDKIKKLGWKEEYEYIDTVREAVNYWRTKEFD